MRCGCGETKYDRSQCGGGATDCPWHGVAWLGLRDENMMLSVVAGEGVVQVFQYWHSHTLTVGECADISQPPTPPPPPPPLPPNW